MKSMASRADGHDRGTMGMRSEGYVVRSERYVVRSGVVGTAGVRYVVRSGMALRAAVVEGNCAYAVHLIKL